MAESASPTTLVFGVFELDVESGELRKHGLKIKLGDREFQVLLALLESTGRTVSRQDLQQRLWADDTFVEFDNGLNNAISRLRSLLGDSAESPRFIETVPRHGYRFVAPVAKPDLPAAAKSTTKPRRFVVAIGIVLAIGLTGVVIYVMAGRPPGIRSIAVLPFGAGLNAQAAGAPDDLGGALSDAVIRNLKKTAALRVASIEAASQFARTKMTPIEIARALKVDAVAKGSLAKSDHALQVNVQLFRAADGRRIWTGSFERPPADFISLAGDVARGIVRGSDLRLTQEQQEELATRPRVDPQAYEDYLKGRYYLSQMNENSWRKALSYYEKAVAAAPNFAEGYIGMAYYYEFTAAVPPDVALPLAKRYSTQALKLNNKLPAAHTARALSLFYCDWNWNESEKEFRRALALDPASERAHRMYAALLSSVGRTQQALAQIRRAHELNLLFGPGRDMAAMIWFNAGQFDQSASQARQLLELYPESVAGHEDLGGDDLFQRKITESVHEFEEALRDGGGPYDIAYLGSAYSKEGERELADRQLHQLQELNAHQYVPQASFAILYANLDEKKRAMDSLNRAYRNHEPLMVYVKVTPWLDSLHQEPQFRQLIKQMHFPD